MSAPKYDQYGQHAVDCACPRCEAGFRPSATLRANAQRWAQAKRDHAARTAREVARAELHRQEVERTDTLIARLTVPIVLPTPEEWAELRSIRTSMFGGKKHE